MGEKIIVITTTETKKQAEELAWGIIQAKLGACVQISKIKSYYNWKGKLENSEEFKLMIKTTEEKYKEIEEFIIKNTKYELPEIIAVNIEQGYNKYLDWIEEEIK